MEVAFIGCLGGHCSASKCLPLVLRSADNPRFQASRLLESVGLAGESCHRIGILLYIGRRHATLLVLQFFAQCCNCSRLVEETLKYASVHLWFNKMASLLVSLAFVTSTPFKCHGYEQTRRTNHASATFEDLYVPLAFGI